MQIVGVVFHQNIFIFQLLLQFVGLFSQLGNSLSQHQLRILVIYLQFFCLSHETQILNGLSMIRASFSLVLVLTIIIQSYCPYAPQSDCDNLNIYSNNLLLSHILSYFTTKALIIINHMKKILGSLNLNTLLWLMIPAMVATPLYSYHMAVSKGEQPPYPHATITDTATHYPQDISFRYVMLFNSSFLALTFYIVFRWIQNQAKKVGFRQPPKYQFYLAEGSIACYGITIGTIDEKGIGNLHTPCAIIFFIVWLVTIVNMTVYMTKMRQWDTSTIGRSSLIIKQILSIYILALWAWCLYNIYMEQGSQPNKQDIYVVIIEWNSVLINLFWIFSLIFEWKHFKLSLVGKK